MHTSERWEAQQGCRLQFTTLAIQRLQVIVPQSSLHKVLLTDTHIVSSWIHHQQEVHPECRLRLMTLPFCELRVILPMNHHATCDQVTPKCLTSYTLKAQTFQRLETITKIQGTWQFQTTRTSRGAVVPNHLAQLTSLQRRFIPHHGPHFDGLREAPRKSARYHLRCSLGDSTATNRALYFTVRGRSTFQILTYKLSVQQLAQHLSFPEHVFNGLPLT
jgi:hypothetical protein